MIQKIKKSILLAITSLTLLAPGLIPLAAATAFADTATGTGAGDNVANGLCNGISSAANGTPDTSGGCSGSSTDGTTTISNVAKLVVNLFSIIVGATAVVMIIYGGFRYIT